MRCLQSERNLALTITIDAHLVKPLAYEVCCNLSTLAIVFIIFKSFVTLRIMTMINRKNYTIGVHPPMFIDTLDNVAFCDSHLRDSVRLVCISVCREIIHKLAVTSKAHVVCYQTAQELF